MLGATLVSGATVGALRNRNDLGAFGQDFRKPRRPTMNAHWAPLSRGIIDDRPPLSWFGQGTPANHLYDKPVFYSSQQSSDESLGSRSTASGSPSRQFSSFTSGKSDELVPLHFFEGTQQETQHCYPGSLLKQRPVPNDAPEPLSLPSLVDVDALVEDPSTRFMVCDPKQGCYGNAYPTPVSGPSMLLQAALQNSMVTPVGQFNVRLSGSSFSEYYREDEVSYGGISANPEFHWESGNKRTLWPNVATANLPFDRRRSSAGWSPFVPSRRPPASRSFSVHAQRGLSRVVEDEAWSCHYRHAQLAMF